MKTIPVWLSAFVVALVAIFGVSPVHAAEPRLFGLYTVWIAGSGDENREEIDQFLDCLIHHSNLHSYWRGEARIEVRGSFALPKLNASVDWDKLAEMLLTPNVGVPSGLPVARADETPLYLVIGGQADFWTGACGRNSEALVAGRNAGVGIVRNDPLCWPTGNTLRTETQIAMHEIVETIDRVLGYAACAAGGRCEGNGICENRCDSFVGLQCPGAPTGTFTGCDGGKVDGWVIQKLGYEGRVLAQCGACITCDFVPQACTAEDPACARVPEPLPLEATGGGGCSWDGWPDKHGPTSGGGWLAVVGLLMLQRGHIRRYF